MCVCLSVRLPLCLSISTSQRILMKFDTWEYFKNLLRKFKFYWFILLCCVILNTDVVLQSNTTLQYLYSNSTCVSSRTTNRHSFIYVFHFFKVMSGDGSLNRNMRHWMTDISVLCLAVILRVHSTNSSLVKIWKKSGGFTWRSMYIYDNISLSSSQNEKYFRQKL
jgi:hypothetical protein